MNTQDSGSYTIKDFVPLIFLFALIGGITLAYQLYYGWCPCSAMQIFMGSFFLIFGFFKVINLPGFVKAYQMYDLIAARFVWYAYLYPFIELALGVAYLYKWQLRVVNSVTLVLMLVSAVGVFNELRKGNKIVCACSGTVFKVPMTYVTSFEDLLMAAMAAAMLFLF